MNMYIHYYIRLDYHPKYGYQPMQEEFDTVMKPGQCSKGDVRPASYSQL